MNIIKHLFSKKIIINTQNNITTLEIKEELSITEFTKILSKSKYKNLLNIINLKFILESPSSQISPKKIHIIQKENIIYIISVKDKKYYISKQIKDNKITETSFQIDLDNNNYQISKTIHSLNGSTEDIKVFNKKQKRNLKFMFLPKKDALQIVTIILEELNNIPNINTIIDIPKLFKAFNIIPSKEYYPIINNDTITLSWPRRYGQTNINIKTRCSLDILLNETQEKIGEITFNYILNIKPSYSGNVGYHIIEEFQNKGYATQALTLLKKLLKNNTYQGNKDLFISTSPENIKSQKVAINNEGELYYEGKIPENDPLSRHSGIPEVKIYRIKI